MAAPWVLLVIFMAMICVGESEGEGPKTVSRLSSALLNSSGWKPNDNTYLVSSDGTFCAGFYNVTPNRYAFAVWYANDSDRTLAWMANLTSLVGANSSLTLQNAALSISDEHGAIVWRSKVTPNSKYAMDLILQDAGNMVFNQWESFKDFPTFNLLPTQDFTAGDVLQSRLANGTYGRDGNYYSLSLQKETSKLSLFYYRNKEEGREPKWYWQSEDSFPIATMTDSGYLNTSIISTGTPIMASDRGKMGILRRLTLNRDGNLRMYSRKRNPPSSSWVVVWEAILAHCKIHGACGENAVCKVNSAWKPICQCPPGFDPSPVDNRSCKPHNDIKELTNVTFVTLDYVNFEGWNSTQVQPTILQDCIDFCRTNTSCVGFAYNLDNGNCVYQFGKLINGYWSPEAHTRMYLKISASSEEAPNLFQGMLSVLENVCPMLVKISSPNDSDHTTEYIIIIWSFAGAELLCGVYFFYAFLRKYSKFRDMDRLLMSGILPSGGPKQFSGKRNLTDNEFYFPEWAFQKVVVEGKPEEVVDKRLNGIRENRSEMEAVRRVVKTALWCSQSRAEERPSMGKVAKMLDGSIEIEDPPKPSLFEDAGGSLQSLFQDTGGGSQLPSYSGMNTSITRSGLSRF
ncbi:hypothetical protein SUGI_0187980 [Cryptomeria japonica]|nr:hypothetical protein SUGI_0187980 [Cryptomeria japonica]